MNPFLMIACTFAAIAAASANPVTIIPVIDEIDHPHYAFNYAVSDPLSKDNKAQWETRNGDVVKGSYSLVEPDGTLRVVDYRADDHSGFHATVKKIGPAIHPPLIAKTVEPLTTIVGPVSYGFGDAHVVEHLPPVTSSVGQWSLPWDPFTHSFGGWVPLGGTSIKKPFVTIFSKQVDKDGNLHKWITGPIPIHRGTVIVKTKH